MNFGALRSDLARLAPQAFWVVERLPTAHPSRLAQGYRQVHAAHGAGSQGSGGADGGALRMDYLEVVARRP